MSACDACGREDGHHLGCPAAFVDSDRVSRLIDAEEWSNALKEAGETVPAVCLFGDCEERRRSDDKRVKFCEFHSNPKNRK